MLTLTKQKHGFTIIELIVVIVVIAILATVGLAAYNGIIPRAKEVATKSELESAAKLIAIEKVTSDSYPASVAVANEGRGVSSDSGARYVYSATKDAYCLQVIPADASVATYYINQDGAIAQGQCPATQSSCFIFDDTTGTITGYANWDITCPKAIIIPSVIEGTTVTRIGSNALSSKGLTSVILPDTVTTISSSAFSNNPKLSYVWLGTGVQSIGSSAFHRNDAETPLKTIVFPSSLVSIGDTAFYTAGIEGSLSIPNSVTTIGMLAFAYNGLTSLTLGSQLATLNSSAFYSNNLTSVRIPHSVTAMNFSVFGANPKSPAAASVNCELPSGSGFSLAQTGCVTHSYY